MDLLENIATTDRLFVQQKFAPLVNRYTISTVAPDGQSAGDFLCQVQQKRMKIREQITFFADEAKTIPVLELKSRKVLEFRGVTDVRLPDGTVIGVLRKVFGKSLLRSTWEIENPAGGVVATAQESSMFMAILRRVWGQIPYLGDVPFMIPFHFDIAGPGGEALGTYRRIWGLRDKYVLDLSADHQRMLDRRVALAFTVALDALQDR